MADAAVTKGASATVTVACKLPAGLILRLWTLREYDEPVLGGGTRTGKIAEPSSLNGVNEVRLTGYCVPKGQDRNFEIAGGSIGYALTPGVPRDFFEEWLKQNADLPAVRKGLIFASDRRDALDHHAKDHAKTRNGLEPIDPKNPPRVGRLRVERYKKDDSDGVAT